MPCLLMWDNSLSPSLVARFGVVGYCVDVHVFLTLPGWRELIVHDLYPEIAISVIIKPRVQHRCIPVPLKITHVKINVVTEKLALCRSDISFAIGGSGGYGQGRYKGTAWHYHAPQQVG